MTERGPESTVKKWGMIPNTPSSSIKAQKERIILPIAFAGMLSSLSSFVYYPPFQNDA